MKGGDTTLARSNLLLIGPRSSGIDDQERDLTYKDPYCGLPQPDYKVGSLSIREGFLEYLLRKVKPWDRD